MKVVGYTYDAWGKIISTTGTAATTIGMVNPFRYRGYYYDSETGFYYLQSRYYDAMVGRFLNADELIGANGDIIGYNMYAYCSNNPVNFVDYTGHSAAGLLAGIGGSIALTPLGLFILGATAVAAAGLYIGAGIADAINSSDSVSKSTSRSDSKAEEKEEDIVVPKEPDNPVIFPVDPNTFNPLGLCKVYRPGTKNGSFISWIDPLKKTEVFRWDENPNYSNGPHYHIHGTGHYYPGMSVPNPYAIIYFPFR